jgi:hypothetical protein
MLAGTASILESTLSGNSAGFVLVGSAEGGGIDNDTGRTGTLLIENTILAGNNAASSPDVNGLLNSLGHNLIGVGDGGSGYADTDLIGTAANPLDPRIGPLQDNGGPTETMALLPGSPAIDAGALTDSEWDQRGPGYPRSVNGATDIGAYELQPSGTGPAALPFRFPEATQVVPVLALNALPTPSVPLRQADAVDRVFASWTGMPWRHVASAEAELWPWAVFSERMWPESN